MSIRSVQTSYSTSSFSSPSINGHPNVLGDHNVDHPPRTAPVRYDPEKFPPGLGRGGRRRSGGFAYQSGNQFSSGNVDIRRPGLSRLPYSSGKRTLSSPSTSPPPPSAQGSKTGEFPKPSSRKMSVERFGLEEESLSIASHNRPTTPRLAATSLTRASAEQPKLTPPCLNAVPLCAPPRLPPVLDKETGAKLVARTLLNRIHAVGKPMRRRMQQCGSNKEYAKSGLSRVICLEC